MSHYEGSITFLQDQLESLFEDKTLIVMAHRHATIRNADRIIVVRDGKIDEIGMHDELMQKKSFYHQLYTEQFENPTKEKAVQ